MTITSPAQGAAVNGAEPGVAFTVSGTYGLSLVQDPTVSVTVDGITYDATMTARTTTEGTFTAHVRAFSAGNVDVVATISATYKLRALTDDDTVTVKVSLTHTAPTLTVTAPAANADVALNEGGAKVLVNVTTADQNQFAGRIVTAVVDGTATTLEAVPGSSTNFTGLVQVAPLPLGNRTLTVTCACSDVPSLTTTQKLTLVGHDTATPHVAVSDPAASESVVVDPSSKIVHVTGTASDTQSGMVGGKAKVAVALSRTGTPLPTTPVRPGDYTSWTVDVPVPTLGAYTLYVWATDAVGNGMSAPLESPFEVMSSYVPKTLDERLNDLNYLVALMSFARDQIATADGTGVSSEVLASTLRQPIDLLSVPLTTAARVGELPVNELRVPIEILRRHLAAQPALPAADDSHYLQTAYESLLSAAGTGYAELRLARGADAATRAALADRLGIPLFGPGGVGTRPDQLDALTLEGPTLTEPALETLFGLPATTVTLDPLREIPQSTLTAWRLSTQRTQWQEQDTTPPARGYVAIVDPDVITQADVVAHAPLGAAVLSLLSERSAQLDAQARTLQQAVAGTADANERFGKLMELSLGSVDVLDEWAAADARGVDIDPALADAGLDRAGLGYLRQLANLAATGTVTDTEWSDAVDVLVGVYRRRQYASWRAQEGSISLAPDTFVAADEGPSVSAFRIDPKARISWLSVLGARMAQRAALLDAADQVVAAAERLALPILRDSLLAAVGAKPDGDPGDALTGLYQVDFRVGGLLRTTRIAQATASLQSLITLVRSGDNHNVASVQDWKLRNAPDVFDTGWSWLGTLGGWRAATTAFLFPEASLDPTLLLESPSDGTPTTWFGDLATVLLTGGALDQATVDGAVLAYEGVAGKWLVDQKISDQPLVYLQGHSREHQATLAQWSAKLQASPMAREIFWGVPMLVAQRLQGAGQYQRALDWYWLAYPYNDTGAASAYDEINQEVRTAPAPPDLTFHSNWTANLDPFALVSGRPAPYLRATLLATIRCLLDYADAEFAAETDESIADARNLYLTARKLLQHPRFVPIAPVQGAGEAALPIPQLATLSQRADVQLAKLRQGRNIAGLPRTQPTAGDGSIRQPTPYHFKTLLVRAQQLTQQASQMEAEYLAALEKYDSKTLQLSDAEHALQVATAQLSVHEAQVQQATDGVTAAMAQQTRAEAMVSTYADAIAHPSNKYETALFHGYQRIRDLQNVIAATDATIGIAQAAAGGCNLWDNLFSFGAAGVSAAVQIGAYATKAVTTAVLDNAQAQLQANQLQASIEERKRNWQMQLASAQQDVLVAKTQVQTANDQVTIALTEQQVAQSQDDQARATLRLLQTQFTNADLYKWMSDTLGGVYRYFLQQATATARLAQTQLAFERAEPEKTFIRSDYWANPRGSSASDTRGMTGAERLAEDVSQLDGYAFSSDSRRLNLAQTFSLAQQLPAEFLTFRETGQISFATPMEWFDGDFPGHYQRLLRQVRVSVVGLVPPSRGLRATLSSSGISQVVTSDDGEFRTVTLRRDPSTVAFTTPLRATGVFDLDTQPDLLLPFEGSGVATTWSLAVPKAANPFDFSTISDVLLTLEYTALHDEGYRVDVITKLNAHRARNADCAFSLARDFPDQWYALNTPDDPAAPRSTRLTLRSIDFPSNIGDLMVSDLAVQVQSSRPVADLPVTLGHAGASATATTDASGIASTRRGVAWAQLVGASPLGDWLLSFGPAANALFAEQAIDDVVLIVSWSGQAGTWA